MERFFAFWLGLTEFRSSLGMTYDNNSLSPCSIAYDQGREFAHTVTLRWFDL